MRCLPWIAMFAGVAAGQTPTGSIEGVVLDSVTRAPVKRAVVVTWSMGPVAQPPPAQIGVVSISGSGNQSMRQNSAKTNASGSFVFRDLPPGSYPLNATHPRYQQARGPALKTVEVKAGETTRVTFELTPGATITGRVVDEDGDPLPGCMPQLLAARPMDPVMMSGSEPSDANGVFSIWGVAAGRFKLRVRCTSPVLESFPLQPVTQPRPLPTVAYPPTFYPGVKQVEQAQVIEVSPGIEKTGVDFQMRPARVYAVKGTLRGADPSRVDVMLAPPNRSDVDAWIGTQTRVDAATGIFTIERVFPGSYTVIALLHDEKAPYGARQDIQVPVDVPVHLELKPGVDISGKVEIEGEFKLPLSSITVQLNNSEPVGVGSPPPKLGEDGTFTIPRVIPGVYRVEAYGPNVFVKSVNWGGQDLPGNVLDSSGGNAGQLRVVVSTKTATIKGTGPVGRFVEAIALSSPHPMRFGAMVDQQGSFTLGALHPGKYRVLLGNTETTDENPGEEVTVGEGETATVTVREPSSR